MKKSILVALLFSFISVLTYAQEGKSKKEIELKGVEASCGQCNFGLEGGGCSLAVKIDGKAYFVDGTAIDEHGNSHGKHGFCTVIRKADIKGEIVDGRFKSKKFKLLSMDK